MIAIDERFIGIPYKFGGRSFEGADCIGVVLLWLEEHGLKYDINQRMISDMKNFWEKSPAKFLSMISEYGRMIPFQYVKKFDFLLFFSGADTLFPTIPAVMVDDRHFLVSYRKDLVSEIIMLNLDWKNKFWGGMKLHKAVEMGVR